MGLIFLNEFHWHDLNIVCHGLNSSKVKKNPDLNSVMQNKCQSSIADFSISRKLSDLFRFTKKVLALKILLCFVLSNKNQRYLKKKKKTF